MKYIQYDSQIDAVVSVSVNPRPPRAGWRWSGSNRRQACRFGGSVDQGFPAGIPRGAPWPGGGLPWLPVRVHLQQIDFVDAAIQEIDLNLAAPITRMNR
jgi:hypothetical protein